MRSVDFRAPLAGITLFYCASALNKLELQQALGRVGRNGDIARRFLMAGVQPVDTAQQAEYVSALVRFHSETQQR